MVDRSTDHAEESPQQDFSTVLPDRTAHIGVATLPTTRIYNPSHRAI
jgi:hypothetical protein